MPTRPRKVLERRLETLLSCSRSAGGTTRMIYTFPEMLLGTACLIVVWAEVK